jgi:hypothetical protein
MARGLEEVKVLGPKYGGRIAEFKSDSSCPHSPRLEVEALLLEMSK